MKHTIKCWDGSLIAVESSSFLEKATLEVYDRAGRLVTALRLEHDQVEELIAALREELDAIAGERVHS